ncbi:succinate dehydrogenase, cytochrome b556 subunit [Celeribacter persicus]|jgi:succinate dehydrogenase, cytochrome b556 subunit|uniref:Succinate dehydrogenase cytochrome b556 subunit n=1 Tax=Celeribacter persicus TaxID=1651082 RepID=A0A2T5HGM6_9RHOB|nr:succinate dehydrogenase, cytochrome b556 subunit [Celeribacter persicus]PTQ70725.1 succinate dehydrogenase subunit C [Celeribacter persicus]
MADVNRGNRPLSPFMLGKYYRPQMTSISSIMVRITGIASLGTVFLAVCWLLAAASSPSVFAAFNSVFSSIFGEILMLAAAWALWYHLLGRLRHVVWDFGYCLDVPTSEKMGWGMFIGATVLTVLTAILFLIF